MLLFSKNTKQNLSILDCYRRCSFHEIIKFIWRILSSGGSTTAGLGGFGGPYRLDAGHDVTQVPQWQKDSVPEHVRKAAREMAQKAFKERYYIVLSAYIPLDMCTQ